MKLFLRIFILLFVVQSYAQQFPYEREWATYFPIVSTFDKQGNAIVRSSASNSQLFPYITNPEDTGTLLLAKLNTDQTLAFVVKFGPSANFSGSITNIDTDEQGNIYVFGDTKATEGIATPGAYQSEFNDNWSDPYDIYYPGMDEPVTIPPSQCSDGFIMKFSPQGEKLWGTYFNGNQEVLALTGKAVGDFIYVTGTTSSYQGIATTGTYIPEWGDDISTHEHRSFMAKIDAQTGIPVLGTYLYDESVYNGFWTVTNFTVDTDGNFYKNFNNELIKISSSGGFVWSSEIIDYTSNDVRNTGIDEDGNVYIIGHTESDTGIATTGTYKPVMTHSEESFIIKYNTANGQKLWGTYLGKVIYTSPNRYGFYAKDGDLYIGSVSGEAGLGTPGVYQQNKNAYNDGVFMKLNVANGQLEWFSYYGGSGIDPIISNIGFDSEDNMYLASGNQPLEPFSPANQIITSNALFDSPITSPYIVRFNYDEDLSVPQSISSATLIYPNPANDVLYLQSTQIITSQTNVSIFDALGRKIVDVQGNDSNTMALNVAHLSEGLYFINITQPENQKAESIKFLKK